MSMEDTAGLDEQLRVELEQAIFRYLAQAGYRLDVEIREWSRREQGGASLGESYTGELFLSFRRGDDATADDLRAARDALRDGFKQGAIDERLRHGDIAHDLVDVFNDGRGLVTLGVLLRVYT